MWGAIAGDVIGSIYEGTPPRNDKYALISAGCRFTDDTVLTVAVADAILNERPYGEALADWACRYPKAGYGRLFRAWVRSWERKPYGSVGNGSAMRVSAVGWAFRSVPQTLAEARGSAEPTHNSDAGIAGAQAVALAIHRSRQGRSPALIRGEIRTRWGFDIARRDRVTPGWTDSALWAWHGAKSWEDAVRRAIGLGRDADTMAAISGSIAEASHPVPAEVVREVEQRLPDDMVDVVRAFRRRHCETGAVPKGLL